MCNFIKKYLITVIVLFIISTSTLFIIDPYSIDQFGHYIDFTYRIFLNLWIITFFIKIVYISIIFYSLFSYIQLRRKKLDNDMISFYRISSYLLLFLSILFVFESMFNYHNIFNLIASFNVYFDYIFLVTLVGLNIFVWIMFSYLKRYYSDYINCPTPILIYPDPDEEFFSSEKTDRPKGIKYFFNIKNNK